MANEQETWTDVIRELVETVGGGVQRELARKTGVSHTYINEWLQGRRPTLRMLQQFADGLGLEGERRERVFRAAGYVEGAWESAGRVADRRRRQPYGTSPADERETWRMLRTEEGEEESGSKVLLAGLSALNEKHGRPLAISLDESDLADLTPEKARATLKFWDEQASAGII